MICITVVIKLPYCGLNSFEMRGGETDRNRRRQNRGRETQRRRETKEGGPERERGREGAVRGWRSAEWQTLSMKREKKKESYKTVNNSKEISREPLANNTIKKQGLLYRERTANPAEQTP